MIDFRYHLVSLISVFIALAVGIVLGAGAVGDTFSKSLAGQVEQLREEKDALRTESDTAATERDQLAGFITATGPGIVSGTIPGQRVGVITDSDATRSSQDAVQELLETAGAERGIEVRLRSTLWTEQGREEREAAAEDLRAAEVAPQVSEDPAALMAQIAHLISAPAEELDGAERERQWGILEDRGLVSVGGDRTAPVEAALYLTASPGDLLPEQTGTDQSAQQLRMVEAQTALVTRLRDARAQAVVSATTEEGDAATSTSLLATLRANPAMEVISTTDRLQQPDGPILAVLALVEALSGEHGDYGTSPDADARVPQLPSSDGAAQPATVPDVSDGGGEG